MSTIAIRRASALLASAAATMALAAPAANAAQQPDPGPGVPQDRIEHTVTEVKVSGSKAAASSTRIEQWLTSDKVRTVTRDVRTGKLVSETVTDRSGSRIYDGESGRLTRSRSTELPQLSRDQEARIVAAQVADGSLRVAEDRGDQLLLESVPGKWVSDEPRSRTTILVSEATLRVIERTSALPDGVFTQRSRSVVDETIARTQRTERHFRMAARGTGAAKGMRGLYLGRVSGGAALEYVLSSTPRSQVVTIAGQRARVKLISSKGERVYRAFINRGGLKAGRSYQVTVKVTPRRGATKTRTERLYLHRSLNRPQGGR